MILDDPHPNRTAFEAWIRSQPCPLSVKRYPVKEGLSRPGCYFDTTVEFAWQAWLNGRHFNRRGEFNEDEALLI